MNRIGKILSLMLFAGTLVGCSNKTVTSDGNESGEAIGFLLSSLKADFGTKGALATNISEISTIGVFAYDDGEEYFGNSMAEKVNGIWGFNPTRFYPSGTDTTLDFIAYSPYIDSAAGTSASGISVASLSDDNLTVSYTMPTDYSQHVDLLVAKPVKGVSGKVADLDFAHALSAIGFKAEGIVELKITSIKIEGMSGAGKMNMSASDGCVWSDFRIVADAEYASGLIDEACPNSDGTSKLITSDGGYLLTIPQVLPASAQVTIEIQNEDASFIDNSTFSLRNVVSEWEQGKIYLYKVNLSYDEISLNPTVEVKEWIEEKLDIDTEVISE